MPDDEGDGFLGDLEEFFSWFDPGDWLLDIGNIVTEGLGVLAEPINNLKDELSAFFSNLISYLNPLSENFILKIAFVPSEGYFEQFIGEIKDVFDEKFQFVDEIGNYLVRLFGAVYDENPDPPSFTVTLPGGKWGTGTIEIIDFSIFADYRFYIRNFIRLILWVPFLMRLYKRLPSVIYI